jgi:hypothetical protein
MHADANALLSQKFLREPLMARGCGNDSRMASFHSKMHG